MDREIGMTWLVVVAACSSVWALPPRQHTEPVPGYDWLAPKQPAPREQMPPPVPAEVVVRDFLRSVELAQHYGPDAKAFVLKKWKGGAVDSALGGDVIDLALSVLSPDFHQGLNLLDQDQVAESADVFEKLSNVDDPFLAVAAANHGATTMIELEQIDRCQAMLDRVRRDHKPIEKYTTASEQFRFMLGYCQVHNLAYEQAAGTFEDFLRLYPNAPERLRTAATQILTELSRREPGRLGDVRDLLRYARRRIGNGSTDDDVLDRQEEAIALLDDLIEEAENQEQQGQSGSQGGSPSGGKRNPGAGATRSTAPRGEQRVGELRSNRAKPGEMWGKMPPKQREQILQTLQQRFPSQYRELLEQYYKQLAKDAAGS
jgi:tetratricopeptide (TPR) repeat protein